MNYWFVRVRWPDGVGIVRVFRTRAEALAWRDDGRDHAPSWRHVTRIIVGRCWSILGPGGHRSRRRYRRQ